MRLNLSVFTCDGLLLLYEAIFSSRNIKDFWRSIMMHECMSGEDFRHITLP